MSKNHQKRKLKVLSALTERSLRHRVMEDVQNTSAIDNLLSYESDTSSFDLSSNSVSSKFHSEFSEDEDDSTDKNELNIYRNSDIESQNFSSENNENTDFENCTLIDVSNTNKLIQSPFKLNSQDLTFTDKLVSWA